MEHAHVAQMQRAAQHPSQHPHHPRPPSDPRRDPRGDGGDPRGEPRGEGRRTAYSNQEYMDHAHAAAHMQRGRDKQQSMDSGYPSSSLDRAR